MHYFSISFTKLTNHSLNFCAFGRKTQFAGHFWENFRKLSKIFLRKLLKMHSFRIFFTKFNKQCVKFLRFWTKKAKCWENLRKFCNFDENSMANLNFYFYFGKFVTKNRAFGNNHFSTIFRFRGAFPIPFPPWLRPWDEGVAGWYLPRPRVVDTPPLRWVWENSRHS